MSEYKKPDSDLARIADLGMRAIESLIKTQGGEVGTIFLAITVDGGMDPDACVTGQGFENEAELLSYLLMHAAQAGERVGLPIQIHPIGQG